MDQHISFRTRLGRAFVPALFMWGNIVLYIVLPILWVDDSRIGIALIAVIAIVMLFVSLYLCTLALDDMKEPAHPFMEHKLMLIVGIFIAGISAVVGAFLHDRIGVFLHNTENAYIGLFLWIMLAVVSRIQYNKKKKVQE